MADPIQSGIDTDYGQYQGGDVGLSKEARSALGTDMSDPVSKYFKQMTDYTSQERKTAQEAQKDIIGKQIQMEQNRLTQEADLARRQAGQMSGIMSQYGKQLMAEPPKRQIEKDTMEGMIGLGALLPVAGAFFGGKGLTGATGALNAMAGLVKGYQEGNKQRIDFEQKKYDDAMKEFDRHQRQIKDAFDLAIKGAQVNQTAALAELKMKLYAENAPMLAELAEKQGIVKTANDNIQMYNNFLKQRMQYENKFSSGRPVEIINKEGNREAITQQEFNERRSRGEDMQLAPRQGASSALLQGRAENIREAFAQAAKDVENITLLPDNTVLGTFAGLTGKSGEGLVDSIRNTFARNITPQEQRFLQQLTSGLDAHLSFALGGGYASSQTKANIDRYKAQLAQEGDTPESYALFLARVRQEMNILAENFPSKPGATKEMNEAVQKFNDVVNKSVPFTVSDVVKATFPGATGPKPPGAKNKLPQRGLSIGEVKAGYRYTGGDPSDKDNWEKVQ